MSSITMGKRYTTSVHGETTSVDSSEFVATPTLELLQTDPIEYFMRVVRQIFCNTSDSAIEAVPQYFDKSYIQEVDDKVLNYEDFLAHVRAQKSKIAKDIRFQWQELHAHRVVEQGRDTLLIVSHHTVRARMLSDESYVQGSVMALFKVDARTGKFFQCNENTHMTHASEEARDLGSTTSTTKTSSIRSPRDTSEEAPKSKSKASPVKTLGNRVLRRVAYRQRHTLEAH